MGLYGHRNIRRVPGEYFVVKLNKEGDLLLYSLLYHWANRIDPVVLVTDT